MDIDQDTERSVWNFGNYLRTALFLLFACAIFSHDKTDLYLLEGGVSGPAVYNNWIGFLGAHAARVMFYTFGLATYPFLLILFLLLLRRFIPGLPRRGTLWWALPVILLGSSIAFAVSSLVNNTLNYLIGQSLKRKGTFAVFAARSYISTFIAQFVDNIVFALLVSRVFFGWSMLQCFTCALTGGAMELLFEIFFSPLGYRIARGIQDERGIAG